MLECVINVSEGRDAGVIAALADAAGSSLLDVHRDEHHHRSVFTLAGPEVEAAARAVARAAVERVDLRGHAGVHPRLGVVDVVPFVPLDGSTLTDAIRARDEFARWAGASLGIPCFLYGPERSLPDVRRAAFAELQPDTGPARPHPRAGTCAVGARPPLVAYNVWLDTSDVEVARRLATAIRGPVVRALGLRVGDTVQVSLNLLNPQQVDPARAFDRVAELARAAGVDVARAELVGLVPAVVLAGIPGDRWAELDVDEFRTIEARLDARRTS